MTELVKLLVDGVEVSPTLIEKKKTPGFADIYHQFALSAPAPGKHTATARVRVIATKAESERTITFVA